MRAMAFVVKHWAKRRQMNEPFNHTLSSYAWVLLVINFLQQRSPPILPCLQEYRRSDYNQNYKKEDDAEEELPWAEGYDCYFYPHADHLADYGKENKESLGELLFSFFEHYANHFDFNASVVSVRMGKYLTRREKGWPNEDDHLFCIEDPFNLSHDLSRVLTNFTFYLTKKELQRAYRRLNQGGTLEAICTPFRPRIGSKT